MGTRIQSLASAFPCTSLRPRAAVLVALFTALLWAGAALPAQADKGGVPNAGSSGANQANGHQGQGAGAVTEPPLATVDVGSSTTSVTSDTSQTAAPALKTGSPNGGANSTSGPYDPDPANPGASGVGQPSGNGTSTNKNGNRPCAGCVGKADYKNPPGQLPDGSDHNKGYECDENEGVGKMNPAHSGCAPGAVTPPTISVKPPNPKAAPPAESRPPAARVEEKGEVQGVEQSPGAPATPPSSPPVAAIPVAIVTPAAGKPEELPFTGGQPLFLGLLGLLSLIAGLGLTRLLGRRSPA